MGIDKFFAWVSKKDKIQTNPSPSVDDTIFVVTPDENTYKETVQAIVDLVPTPAPSLPIASNLASPAAIPDPGKVAGASFAVISGKSYELIGHVNIENGGAANACRLTFEDSTCAVSFAEIDFHRVEPSTNAGIQGIGVNDNVGVPSGYTNVYLYGMVTCSVSGNLVLSGLSVGGSGTLHQVGISLKEIDLTQA
jgi:hypothetical protein